MQINMNIEFEYNAITEGGAELKPMFGRGHVGLTNLGNYCYMNSILQAVWSIPAFAQMYVLGVENIMRSVPADVLFDFPAQFAKVGHALVTGAWLYLHHVLWFCALPAVSAVFGSGLSTCGCGPICLQFLWECVDSVWRCLPLGILLRNQVQTA
jgi:hypothetical protein